jgi:hypothetical protein
MKIQKNKNYGIQNFPNLINKNILEKKINKKKLNR